MKQKTHSGLKKRIKITGRGKIKFQKPAKRHLLINKSKRQKSTNPFGASLDLSDASRIRKLMGLKVN